MKFADLHTHTTFSDGTSTPYELIKLAKDNGLSAVAICDHDTIDGIFPAKEAAGETGIEIIPALELSAEHNNAEVHILGFLIDYEDANLLSRLKKMRQDRVSRMHEMVEKLKSQGISINVDKVFRLAGAATVGRMHLARILHVEGFVSTLQGAFNKYIGEHRPAYVSRFKLTPKEAIELVLSAKGIPVLAHPYILNNDKVIEEFSGYGLRGIEAYYPEHLPSVTKHYEEVADRLNLIKTGGSDFHGAIKPQNPLGRVKVPYSVVEELKDAKKKLG
ncbi:MAG: PHP domain-containing protein [Candidatus Omnitrophota bacterium]|nr:PHP domain-containing protein [Candidatus Omnitrophota bacterium]